MRLGRDQRAEAASLVVARRMLEFELRLRDDLFVGNVGAWFHRCLRMR